MKLRAAFAVALFATSVVATAQRVGNYPLTPNSSPSLIAVPFTMLEVSSPATSSGNIGAVAIRSLRSPCPSAFKVKFFHHTSGIYTPYAERGPFNITASITVVPMNPPVAVTEGDVIGVVVLTDCVAVVGQVPKESKETLLFSGDVSGPVNFNSAVARIEHFELALYGAPSMNSEVRTQVLIVAGATAGAFGSQFKTDLFLTNARVQRSAGRLVYHPEGTSGTQTDPSFGFSMDFARTLTFPNFVTANLGRTGKGSIDVYTTIGFEPPMVSARIYDEGGGETKGFTLDALPLHEALDRFEVAVLFAPIDPAKFRMNIGVRSLDETTDVLYQAVDRNGVLRAAVTRNYQPNYYEQTDYRGIFGFDPQAGDTVFVFTERGSAYVYSSIIDNASNDPSLQVAKDLK